MSLDSRNYQKSLDGATLSEDEISSLYQVPLFSEDSSSIRVLCSFNIDDLESSHCNFLNIYCIRR